MQSKYQQTFDHLQTLHGRLVKTKINAKASAKKRGNEFNLTIDDMWSMWNKQQGLCHYTGWEMSTLTKSDRLLSIERLNNSIGYTPENCVLVCWPVNKARSGQTQEQFIDMCKAIAIRHQ